MPRFPIPSGHHTVTPGFAVPKASQVLAFLFDEANPEHGMDPMPAWLA